MVCMEIIKGSRKKLIITIFIVLFLLLFSLSIYVNYRNDYHNSLQLYRVSNI